MKNHEITDTMRLIIIALIERGGCFEGCAGELSAEIANTIINGESLIVVPSATAIGKAIAARPGLFGGLFRFAQISYGPQTKYIFRGVAKGVSKRDLRNIRAAIVERFDRLYTRRISPLQILEEIKKDSPATLRKR